MKKIDLNKLIEKQNLSVADLADRLFPMHKYPNLALSRVLKGESVLDANQISILSFYTGLSIQDLFTGENWRYKIVSSKHTLESSEYKALIDMEGKKVSLYAKGSLLHEEILTDSAITLRELISKIEFLIKSK